MFSKLPPSDQATQFDPFSPVVAEQLGDKKDHYILTHANGVRGYFKTMSKPRAIVPRVTYFLDQLLDNGMVPETTEYEYNGVSGLWMEYLTDYQTLLGQRWFFLDLVSVRQLSNLSITYYLAGSYDHNSGNLMMGHDRREIKSVDNEGVICQDGVYGDWPLLNIKNEEASLKLIDFSRHEVQTMNRDTFLIYAKEFLTESAYALAQEETCSSKSDVFPQNVKFIRIDDNLWLYRRREGLTFPHVRHFEKSSLERIRLLETSHLAPLLEGVDDHHKRNYLTLFFKRRDCFLQQVKQKNFYDII